MWSRREQWTVRLRPELETQRDSWGQLRTFQREQLERRGANDQARPRSKRIAAGVPKMIVKRSHDHEPSVNEVMTIEPAPHLKVGADLMRSDRGSG